MRVVVTRPEPDAKRTATALRALGHEVLVAPLMTVQRMGADLSGRWSAVVITSANAPNAIADNAKKTALIDLPLFAVGQRSAEAAQEAGFTKVTSAEGNVRDLVRTLATVRANAEGPLLYLAGEDRAADLVGELSGHGIAAEMRVVYRAVAAPFPSALIEALTAGEVDAVLHFSRRSAENYAAGASQAGIAGPALAVRHFCLSAQAAEPLTGATQVTVAAQPDEAALIALLQAPAA